MRRLALAIALACVLSGVVRSGEIHTTGAVATPTPSPAPGESHPSGAVASADWEINTGETATQESSVVLTIIVTLISIVP